MIDYTHPFAVCTVSVASVRRSPGQRSEQVSQVLFGEVVELIEKKGRSWYFVRCTWDNCKGWVHITQLEAITTEQAQNYMSDHAITLEFIQPLVFDEQFMPIPMGARLPNFDGIQFHFTEKQGQFSGQAIFTKDVKLEKGRILDFARRYLHVPEQWGGRSPLGIDSGGLIQQVFEFIGVHLARHCRHQVLSGATIHFVEMAEPGDVAFFENAAGVITHAGIILEGGRILHVFGKVRIDLVDHFGIYHQKLGRYTHRLRIVKRIVHFPEKSKQEATISQAKEPFQFSIFNE